MSTVSLTTKQAFLLERWQQIQQGRSSEKKKKSSHGGHGVHGVIFGEARLKTGIRRLING
jgi:hypothetical protein